MSNGELDAKRRIQTPVRVKPGQSKFPSVGGGAYKVPSCNYFSVRLESDTVNDGGARPPNVGEIRAGYSTVESSIQCAIGIITDDAGTGYQDLAICLNGDAISDIVATRGDISFNGSAGTKSRVQATVGIVALQNKIGQNRVRVRGPCQQDFSVGLNGNHAPPRNWERRVDNYAMCSKALIQRPGVEQLALFQRFQPGSKVQWLRTILPMHSSPRQLAGRFPPFDPIKHGSALKNELGQKINELVPGILSRVNSWRSRSSIHQTRFPAEPNKAPRKIASSLNCFSRDPLERAGCHAFAATLQNPEPEYFPAKACRPCKFACFRGAIGVFHLLANHPRNHGTRNVGRARNLRLQNAWLA